MNGMEPLNPSSLSDFVWYFLRLGAFGFGGPIALAGRMNRDLVEDRRWVSRQDYIEGLAFAQLSPGPLAAQLAMYLGWAKAGRFAAALVSAVFIAPSFLNRSSRNRHHHPKRDPASPKDTGTGSHPVDARWDRNGDYGVDRI